MYFVKYGKEYAEILRLIGREAEAADAELEAENLLDGAAMTDDARLLSVGVKLRDTDLEKMFKDTFAEMGIESKTNGCIHNPVGGCDSTPMTRGGIKSVTFAAQNPMLTWYYHTFHDKAERFEMETVGDGFDVVLSVIDKIAAFQEEKGFNGPQKK